MMQDSPFSEDYFIARDRFREAAKQANAELSELPLEAKGPQGEDLTIDIAWLGSPSPDRLLLHTSGVHGVEGFVGSAIQTMLLQETLELKESEAIVFMHGINPYGMAWLRRFNENNVDLNRNFLSAGEHFEGAAKGYHLLNKFLNPTTPPRSMDFFYLKAVWNILRYGFTNLKQAVAQGQFEYPQGLFFGGEAREQSSRVVMEWLSKHLEGIKATLVIDVHTGLGKYGEDVLLIGEDTAPEQEEQLRNQFGDRISKLDPKQEAFQPKGDFLRALRTDFTELTWTCICQEFGTYQPLKVLRCLREENQWHHHGQKADLSHPSKRNLLQAFCPEDPAWRNRILERGKELFKLAKDQFFSS